jgi:2,4-dienoyl-CoA reductase-like NADH-dependent reductase (Old Yellow Enzyme family)
VENRSRFGLEVAKACAEAVGEKRVGLRLSPYSTYGGEPDPPVRGPNGGP